jgi:hypothetical protein
VCLINAEVEDEKYFFIVIIRRGLDFVSNYLVIYFAIIVGIFLADDDQRWST